MCASSVHAIDKWLTVKVLNRLHCFHSYTILHLQTSQGCGCTIKRAGVFQHVIIVSDRLLEREPNRFGFEIILVVDRKQVKIILLCCLPVSFWFEFCSYHISTSRLHSRIAMRQPSRLLQFVNFAQDIQQGSHAWSVAPVWFLLVNYLVYTLTDSICYASTL